MNIYAAIILAASLLNPPALAANKLVGRLYDGPLRPLEEICVVHDLATINGQKIIRRWHTAPIKWMELPPGAYEGTTLKDLGFYLNAFFESERQEVFTFTCEAGHYYDVVINKELKIVEVIDYPEGVDEEYRKARLKRLKPGCLSMAENLRKQYCPIPDLKEQKKAQKKRKKEEKKK